MMGVSVIRGFSSNCRKIIMVPTYALFPYTTLFRSNVKRSIDAGIHAAFLSGNAIDGVIEVLPNHPVDRVPAQERSEEHTSELQSPYDLVCRLLLEKKKNNNNLDQYAN